jgi:hypothetical protein
MAPAGPVAPGAPVAPAGPAGPAGPTAGLHDSVPTVAGATGAVYVRQPPKWATMKYGGVVLGVPATVCDTSNVTHGAEGNAQGGVCGFTGLTGVCARSASANMSASFTARYPGQVNCSCGA